MAIRNNDESGTRSAEGGTAAHRWNVEPTPVAPREGDPPPRLLLVEDDQASHAVMRKLLARKGFEVLSAFTVAEAMRQLEARPNTIILDLMLPDGDGRQVLAQVRKKKLPIRVAVTTGVADTDHLQAVRDLQPELLIRKPVDFGAMLRGLGFAP